MKNEFILEHGGLPDIGAAFTLADVGQDVFEQRPVRQDGGNFTVNEGDALFFTRDISHRFRPALKNRVQFLKRLRQLRQALSLLFKGFPIRRFAVFRSRLQRDLLFNPSPSIELQL